MNTITLLVLCHDFDLAKNFYLDYLGFDVQMDGRVGSEAAGFRRVVFRHRLVTGLEVEFALAHGEEEKARVGKLGGTRCLFSIPSKNLPQILDEIKNTPLYLDYNEVPYANFLHLKDPMGNLITLYDSFE